MRRIILILYLLFTGCLLGMQAPQAHAEIGIIMHNNSSTNLYWNTIDDATTLNSGTTTISSLPGSQIYIDCEASPIDPDRIICGANSITTGDVLSYMYDADANTMTALTTATSDTPTSYTYEAPFYDIEFEDTTGDALIVYIEETDNNVKYRTLLATDTDWSSEQTLSGSNYDDIRKVLLARDPATDDIMMAYTEDTAAGGNLRTVLWDGSSWGSPTNHGQTHEVILEMRPLHFGIAWEGDRSEAVLAWWECPGGTGSCDAKEKNNNVRYNTWTSGSWNTAGIIGNLETKGEPVGLKMATEYKSTHNKIAVCYVSGVTHVVRCSIWNNTSWSTEHASVIDVEPQRATPSQYDLAWSYESGNEDLILISLDKGDSLWHVSYDESAGTWSTKYNLTNNTWQNQAVQVRANPNGTSMGSSLEEDDGFDQHYLFCSSGCKTATNWLATNVLSLDSTNSNVQSTSIVYLDGSQNQPPTLNVDEPDGTGDTVAAGDNYSIQYDLADPDNVVTAAFYYDSDSSGLDGTAITGACATAAEGTNATCTWNTTGVTPGSYYVYGITNDGVNSQVSDYSPGQITITSGASLTFVVSSDAFPDLTPSTPVFATTTLSIDTSNSSGWNVTLARDDSDTTIDLNTDATVDIVDQTDWVPGAATTTAGNAVRLSSLDNSGDVLAFRVMTASGTTAFISTAWWGSVDDYADNVNTLWAGIPDTAKKVGDSNVSCSGANCALNTVLYYLDVPTTQKTGAYSGDITFTATTN